MSGHPRSVDQDEIDFRNKIEIMVDSLDRNSVSHREQCIDYLLTIDEMESEKSILQLTIKKLNRVKVEFNKDNDNTLPKLSLNLAP